MKKASDVLYRVSSILYFILGGVYVLSGILRLSVGIPTRVDDGQLPGIISDGILLLVAASISFCEGVVANKVMRGETTHIAAIAWGAVGFVGAYSTGVPLALAGIFALIVEKQGQQPVTESQVIDEPKEEEQKPENK